MKYKFNKEELEVIVKESLSIAEVCRKMGIKAAGGNYKTINSKIKNWNINIDHFTGQVWNQGMRYRDFTKRVDLETVLVENSTYTSSSSLKRRLFKEGLKCKKCEKCMMDKWLGQNIPLELHHINGISDDNRLDNLQVLCPNCHALTDNYRRKKCSSGETVETQQT